MVLAPKRHTKYQKNPVAPKHAGHREVAHCARKEQSSCLALRDSREGCRSGNRDLHALRKLSEVAHMRVLEFGCGPAAMDGPGEFSLCAEDEFQA